MSKPENMPANAAPNTAEPIDEPRYGGYCFFCPNFPQPAEMLSSFHEINGKRMKRVADLIEKVVKIEKRQDVGEN